MRIQAWSDRLQRVDRSYAVRDCYGAHLAPSLPRAPSFADPHAIVSRQSPFPQCCSG
jgi:hypothetical protein